MRLIVIFLITLPAFSQDYIVLNGLKYRVEKVETIDGVTHIKTAGPKKLCTPVNLNVFSSLFKNAQETTSFNKNDRPKREYHTPQNKSHESKPVRTYHRKPARLDKPDRSETLSYQ